MTAKNTRAACPDCQPEVATRLRACHGIDPRNERMRDLGPQDCSDSPGHHRLSARLLILGSLRMQRTNRPVCNTSPSGVAWHGLRFLKS